MDVRYRKYPIHHSTYSKYIPLVKYRLKSAGILLVVYIWNMCCDSWDIFHIPLHFMGYLIRIHNNFFISFGCGIIFRSPIFQNHSQTKYHITKNRTCPISKVRQQRDIDTNNAFKQFGNFFMHNSSLGTKCRPMVGKTRKN